MIIRNSLKSLWRAKGRTILFFTLIMILTLLMSMGVSIFAAVKGFLKDCDEFYTTIGVLEYKGTQYPNEIIYDEGMQEEMATLDLMPLLEEEAVESFAWSDKRLGVITGLDRKDFDVYARNEAVVILGGIGSTGMEEDGSEILTANVYDVLYAQEDKAGTMVMIEQNEVYPLEKGKTYLAHGEFYYGRTSYPYFRVTEFTCVPAQEKGVLYTPLAEVTKANGKYEIPEDLPFKQMAEIIKVRNNSVVLQASPDVKTLYPFHEEQLALSSGDFFTEEEYSGNAKVCMISEQLAGVLSVEVGDRLEIGDVYREGMDIYQSYYPENGFDTSASYEIKGIFKGTPDYNFYVYVPKDAQAASESGTDGGYTIGQFVLKNDSAEEFEQKAEAFLNGRFHLTIYDQGYEVTTRSYISILMVTRIATVLCITAAVAVLLLFGYLFVYKQRETAEIMVLLGTKRAQILWFFEAGAGLVALLAAFLGGLLGFLLHGNIVKSIIGIAEGLQIKPESFSEMKLGIIRILSFEPKLKYPLFLGVTLLIAVGAFLSVFGFIHAAFVKRKGNSKKVMQVKPVRKSSKLSGSAMKYTLLSMRRSGLRSIAVPVLALLAVVLMGSLTQAAAGYRQRLSEVCMNTDIRAYYTDVKGKGVHNLVVDSAKAAELYFTGIPEELYGERKRPYLYLASEKNDADYENIHIMIPASLLQRETMGAKFSRGFDLVQTNSLRNASDFYFLNELEMQWLQGFDESFLTETVIEGVVNCVVPEGFLRNRQLSLGDTFKVAVYWETKEGWYQEIPFRVVGAYPASDGSETIYCPLRVHFPTFLVWGEDNKATGSAEENNRTGYVFTAEERSWLKDWSFVSSKILVKSANLENLRNYLTEQDFSEVSNMGAVRQFIVIEDREYQNTVSNLKQQILYTDYLYPVLYVLIILMGITVSCLLTSGRKQEIALMRGMGAKKTRILVTFLSEQFLLCFLGCLAGFGLWYVTGNRFAENHLWLGATFLAGYLGGTLFTVLRINHVKLSVLLADKEE